jgi:hypothetical protein
LSVKLCCARLPLSLLFLDLRSVLILTDLRIQCLIVAHVTDNEPTPIPHLRHTGAAHEGEY